MNPIEENGQCANITDILETSTLFRLKIGIFWLSRNFQATLHPLNAVGSPKISVHPGTGSETFAMCLNNAKASPFLTFVGLCDNVTVFSPNKQEPLGKILRRKASKIGDDEADIYCFATNTKFTLKSVKDGSPATMKIFDSNGTVLGTASVSKWETSRVYCTTTTSIEQLSFHVNEGISEPTKIMLLVAFINWARWSKHEVSAPILSPSTKKLIIASLLFFLGLPILAFLIVMLSH